MKKTAVIILVIGLAVSLFTGFNYVTREKVVDIGSMEISANKNHSVSWSPIVGLAILVVGAGLWLTANKNTTT